MDLNNVKKYHKPFSSPEFSKRPISWQGEDLKTDPDYASIISDYLKEFGSSNPIDDEDFFADDVDFSHQYNTNSKISNIPNNFVLHQFEDMRLRHCGKAISQLLLYRPTWNIALSISSFIR